jgi:hypothetical protein
LYQLTAAQYKYVLVADQAAELDVTLELTVAIVAAQISNAAVGLALGVFADKLEELEDRLFATVQHME